MNPKTVNMTFFSNDYSTGAHKKILDALVASNNEILPGYCEDKYCKRAEDKIKKALNNQNANVFFLSGGTITNKTAVSTMLSDNEGVICADTGHINTHEAGAVESTGHKVLTIQNTNGKINPKVLQAYIEDYKQDSNNVQMVEPAMVFISYPTEYGTLYSLKELKQISSVCKKNNLLLYLDGARLGYGLASQKSDVTLSDIAKLCDIFYIGGTKMGALCGEALVFTKGNAPKRFLTKMKYHGGLLAKGRILGVQFDCLFTDSTYLKIGKTACEKALEIGKIFTSFGYELISPVESNQVFVKLPNTVAEKLSERIVYRFWTKYDKENIVARFVTTWATSKSDIDSLKTALKDINLLQNCH